jgi:hypothetical protein
MRGEEKSSLSLAPWGDKARARGRRTENHGRGSEPVGGGKSVRLIILVRIILCNL